MRWVCIKIAVICPISGNRTIVAQLREKCPLIVLVDVHPAQAATSMSYSILLSGPKVAFDITNAGDFQPMLQSFKFTV